MSKSIRLYFQTALGKTASITIPNAKVYEDLTNDDVKAAMSRIIATGIVSVTAGPLTTSEKAEYITVTQKEYAVE